MAVGQLGVDPGDQTTGKRRAKLVRKNATTSQMRDVLSKLKVLQDSQLKDVQQRLAQAGVRSKDIAFAIIFARMMLPEVWAATLDRLLALVPMPDPGFANLLWQAIVGVWPADPADEDGLRERLHGYAEKAMREAGDHTRWTAVDADFEAAVQAVVEQLAARTGAKLRA